MKMSKELMREPLVNDVKVMSFFDLYLFIFLTYLTIDMG